MHFTVGLSCPHKVVETRLYLSPVYNRVTANSLFVGKVPYSKGDKHLGFG